MEKYSQFRDHGTGIQPFLPLIPAKSNIFWNPALRPVKFIVGLVRTTLVLLLLAVYFFLVEGVCIVFKPIPMVYRASTHLFTAITGSLILHSVLGIASISVETVSRKRGRISHSNERWSPKAGDVIVCNWISWIELIWLAIRFNPCFVQAVVDPMPASSSGSVPTDTAITVRGFVQLSLFSMILSVGCGPLAAQERMEILYTFEDLRKKVDGPIVIFPELTTSNGRALLKFARVFTKQAVPVKHYGVFIMSIRCDPPTPFRSGISSAVPSFLNPLGHIFNVASSLTLRHSISIRLLAPSDSPSSGSFLPSDNMETAKQDDLIEICASLISQMARLKQIQLGWENKLDFLRMYSRKRHFLFTSYENNR